MTGEKPTETAAPSTPPLDPGARASLSIHPNVGADWPASGLGPLEILCEGLPDPSTLDKGAWIAVFPGAPARKRGLVSRLLTPRTAPHVHLAIRCTALLARGYVRVCADEHGTAFGQVP
jgi:hypothetical protein